MIVTRLPPWRAVEPPYGMIMACMAVAQERRRHGPLVSLYEGILRRQLEPYRRFVDDQYRLLNDPTHPRYEAP